MANTFRTAPVTRTALALLTPDLVFARTVNRDYEADFTGGTGNVVNVRKPITLTADSRAYGATSAINVATVTEPATVPVTLSTNIYSAVALTDEEKTFEIADFARQVLAPQTAAIARACEKALIDEMKTLVADTTLASAYSASDPLATFVSARKALRDMGAPTQNLFAAVGTKIAADILKTDAIRRVDASGTDDALRAAQIGNLMGFTVIESNALNEDEMIFYHRDAFTLAVRAPRVPEGVAFGQSVSEGGFALRWIQDYDSSVLADRSVVSTFIGVETMTMTQLDMDDVASDVTPALRIDLSPVVTP